MSLPERAIIPDKIRTARALSLFDLSRVDTRCLLPHVHAVKPRGSLSSTMHLMQQLRLR